jgi:hypothetical protein
VTVTGLRYQRLGGDQVSSLGDCSRQNRPMCARQSDELDQRYALAVDEELMLLEGNLSVEQTDQTIREAVEALGAIGFAVGLIAPAAVLAITTVGAAIGRRRRRSPSPRGQRETRSASREDAPKGGRFRRTMGEIGD